MKRLLAVIALAVPGAILLDSLRAEADAIACRPIESYTLSLSTATFNGAPTMNGFSTDGGVSFFATRSSGTIASVPDGGACGEDARQVRVHFTDPWSGQPVEVLLGEAP